MARSARSRSSFLSFLSLEKASEPRSAGPESRPSPGRFWVGAPACDPRPGHQRRPRLPRAADQTSLRGEPGAQPTPAVSGAPRSRGPLHSQQPRAGAAGRGASGPPPSTSLGLRPAVPPTSSLLPATCLGAPRRQVPRTLVLGLFEACFAALRKPKLKNGLTPSPCLSIAGTGLRAEALMPPVGRSSWQERLAGPSLLLASRGFLSHP